MSDSTPLAKTCPHVISRGRLGKDKLIFLIHMTFAMKLMFQKSLLVLFFLFLPYIKWFLMFRFKLAYLFPLKILEQLQIVSLKISTGYISFYFLKLWPIHFSTLKWKLNMYFPQEMCHIIILNFFEETRRPKWKTFWD